MSELKITYENVDNLIPYVNNPRKNDEAVDAVASSIKNFGFKVPIVVDRENEIVTGHTRLKAAKKLGIKEVPCIIADNLSDAQIKAFRLADNKVSELSEWDFELLSEELQELDILDLDLDFEMSEFGFDLKEIDSEEVIEDDFDCTPQEDTTVKLGDIYQLGNHRLMCEDSTDILDVKKLVGGWK